MKIKKGFITNSSSTCYLIDRRSLTNAELWAIRENEEHLATPVERGLTRASAYAEGRDILYYLEMLRGIDSWIESFIRSGINKVGLDNLIFVRYSDEGMGGYPLHLEIIEKRAFSRTDQ